MWVYKCAFLLLVNYVVSSTTADKCNISDSECLRSSIQKSIPILVEGSKELGMEPLDVMHISGIKIDLAGLKLKMSDVHIKGLKHAIIDKVKIDMEKKQMHVVFRTDISMVSKYKASGKLLILPIVGDGDSVITLKNLQIDLLMPFHLIKNDTGKDIVELKSHRFKFDVKENVNFHMTNLFNGNKLLSEAMLKFMNENWKILTQEFGTPMLEKPMLKTFLNVKAILNSRPLDELVSY